MVRFDAKRFSADVAMNLRAAPRGTRARLEKVVPTASLSRLLAGHEPRVSHVAAICDFLGLKFDHYTCRNARVRDYIIV